MASDPDDPDDPSSPAIPAAPAAPALAPLVATRPGFDPARSLACQQAAQAAYAAAIAKGMSELPVS